MRRSGWMNEGHSDGQRGWRHKRTDGCKKAGSGCRRMEEHKSNHGEKMEEDGWRNNTRRERPLLPLLSHVPLHPLIHLSQPPPHPAFSLRETILSEKSSPLSDIRSLGSLNYKPVGRDIICIHMTTDHPAPPLRLPCGSAVCPGCNGSGRGADLSLHLRPEA